MAAAAGQVGAGLVAAGPAVVAEVAMAVGAAVAAQVGPVVAMVVRTLQVAKVVVAREAGVLEGRGEVVEGAAEVDL